MAFAFLSAGRALCWSNFEAINHCSNSQEHLQKKALAQFALGAAQSKPTAIKTAIKRKLSLEFRETFFK
jgi:hypothetical protein